MASLLSVNVGMPKDVAWQGKTVHTGIWKSPLTGPATVRRLNIDGDGQGDLGGHGGEQRAVLVYQIESMRYWQSELGQFEVEFGQFGENFTVEGLGDDEVCIGDRYRIGTAEFEVSQPRVTCFRIGMRLGAPTLPSLLVARHRPGFYFRVITEGEVRAGDEIVRTRRGPHEMSVADIDALLYLPHREADALKAAVDIPALSPGWQQSFRDLLAGDDKAAPPAGVEPGWAGFRSLRVRDVVRESSTITSFCFVARDGAALPRPLPGQYLTLRLAGAGDPAPVRSYSLSSAPTGAGYRISVKRDGAASQWLHSRLRVGAEVEVAAPRGDFVLAENAGPVLLISAGVGITPVLAMLHQLADEHSEREVWWLHTARDAAQQAFAEEAHELLAALPKAHEHVCHTASGQRLSASTLAELGLPTDASAYICGPEGFMTAIRDALTGLGIEPGRINTELFGALAPINPGVTNVSHVPPHQPGGPVGTGPLVTFARSGLSVPWQEKQDSLLELAEACDVPTRWSCRSGVCHTCVTPLLAGRTSYAPDPLEQPESGQVLVCCARPESDVVLDL
ncbi:MAG TPA: MOSC and FAD-binding oxidoreductase domain-containing protein [Pseudonocardiaceae bacterium]|jgi:ferredoxin-NADP reductase/MOSC domain-containing protein YiiM